jgi:transposase
MRRGGTVPGLDAERQWRVEAERWRVEAEGLATRNVVLEAENTALRARNSEVLKENTALRARLDKLKDQTAELKNQMAALKQKVVTLTKKVFGTSSEKAKTKGDKDADAAPDPTPGTANSTPQDPDVPGAGPPPRPKRGQQKGSRGHGRRDYSNLPTEERVHDLPPERRCCQHCGAGYVGFGDERSYQIDWQVRLVRIVHVRRTYRRTCRCPSPGVLAAPVAPKPIRKGLFTSQFLARLLVGKYLLGLPLCRIGTALAHDGLPVAQGTLVGTLEKVSALLAPVQAAIQARNAASAHLHVDETSWWVFQAVEGKKNNRWWLWVFVAADTTVFRVERSRSLAALNAHLGVDLDTKTLPEGRRLLLSSDFFTVYQSIATVQGVDPLWCWAHIRRYFVRAGDAHRQLRDWSAQWVHRISALYVAHKARHAAVTPEQAGRAEAEYAAALAGIDTARTEQAAKTDLHPAAGKVLATLDHEWDGLARHQQYPDLPLDNNAAERALRTPVVGRKNFYGSGSTWSAELAGRAWTVTATAAHAGLNPVIYLDDYFDACAHNDAKPLEGEALQRFLPWTADPADLTRWRGASHGPAP